MRAFSRRGVPDGLGDGSPVLVLRSESPERVLFVPTTIAAELTQIMQPKPNTSSENTRTTPDDLSPVQQLARQLLQCASDDPTLRNRLPLTEAADVPGAAMAPLAEAVEVHVPVAAL
jgi:hypothetical protein